MGTWTRTSTKTECKAWRGQTRRWDKSGRGRWYNIKVNLFLGGWGGWGHTSPQSFKYVGITVSPQNLICTWFSQTSMIEEAMWHSELHVPWDEMITFKEMLHSKLQHSDSKQTSTHTMTVTIHCWIIPWLFCCGVVGVEPPPNPNPKFIPVVLLPLVRGVPNPNPLLKSPPKADTREYCRYESTAVTILFIYLLYGYIANPMTWLAL